MTHLYVIIVYIPLRCIDCLRSYLKQILNSRTKNPFVFIIILMCKPTLQDIPRFTLKQIGSWLS